MNKRLFVLLPIALLTLVGCNKDKENADDSSGEDAPAGIQSFEIDFGDTSYYDDKVFPKFDYGNTTVQQVEMAGFTWNALNCWANKGYNEGDPYYLMMNNKGSNEVPNTVTSFIGNHTKLGSITKVEIVFNTGSVSTNANIRIALGKSEMTSGDVSGDKKNEGTQSAGGTLSCEASKSDGYNYFMVSNLTGTKKYNAQLAKLKVTIE